MLLASLKRRWCVQRHKRKLEKAPPCLGVCGSPSTPEAPFVAENHTKNQLISDMNTFTSSQKHSSWFRRRRRRGGVSVSQTVWDFLSWVQQLNPPGLHPNYLMHEETQSIIISTATPALHADGNLSRAEASHFPAHVMTDTCISLTPDFSFRAKDWLMLQEKKVTQSLILFIWT